MTALGAVLRTPCIGVCSTTYGDLVCRGCARHAHEITGWNQYPEAARQLIWERLDATMLQVAARWLRVVDPPRLAAATTRWRVPCREADPDPVRAFRLLRAVADRIGDPADAGLDLAGRAPGAVRAAMVGELRERAIADYEHAYRVRIQG